MAYTKAIYAAPPLVKGRALYIMSHYKTDPYLQQRERVAHMQTYIHSAALPVEDRDLYIKPLYRWTSIFGRDRDECIDVCISYHPAPARYMSVFKHTETRHISCGTRMSTYAESDVDSVDWS